jgi:XTP/dITP diphosphohydrolase
MTNIPFKLLVGTHNTGKLAEFRSMLGHLPVELFSLEDFPQIGEVEETGSTFAENAELKAREYARLSGLHSLADDSGLEVKALGGRPGVLSARYGGSQRDYADKMQLILDEIRAAEETDRSARFVSSIALARPTGEIAFTAEGICDGIIAESPKGTQGFGYDPIFIPDGYTQTFGELPEDIKNEISHRARASKIIMRYLPDFIGL